MVTGKFQIRLLLLIMLLCGCSDDFLNEQAPVIHSAETPLIISSLNVKTTVNLNIPAAGDQPYYIRTYPKWLEFGSLHGEFTKGKANLTITFREPDDDTTSSNYYIAEVVIVVENTGYFRIQVICSEPSD